MSSTDVLKVSEANALKNNQIIANVVGKGMKTKGGNGKKLGAFSAAAFITLALVAFVVFFGSGTLIPAAISERLIEETDVQYADAMESKALVFQQALASGEVPANTVSRLKENGVLVGYEQDGGFVENVAGTSLKMGDRIITAGNFVTAVNSDAALYNAFNNATYSRAAYYYDESAKKVFKEIGTSRNNYTEESDFSEVMSEIVGEGNNIDVNNVAEVEKSYTNDKGEKVTYYEYEEIGSRADGEAANFVEMVRAKNSAYSTEKATLNAADTLNVADTVAKEQKSSLFFLAFMENISKMKAGEGNGSKINEAMNFLYDAQESQVVDVKTGEVVTVTGSMLESPSLYAVLAGERVDTREVENYSADRVLATVENQVGAAANNDTLSGTIASTAEKIKGAIGRFLTGGNAEADSAALEKVVPTINSSLVDNSFSDIRGIAGGEMLVEGAVNVGKALAKASGATAGDAAAAKDYARLNTTIVALETEADRMNRSPFDVTSKNTFLGSLIYNMAISLGNSGTILGKLGSVVRTAASSVTALMPATHADDKGGSYLANFGRCQTLGNIGAVGTAGCAMVATFDTSTLNNTFNDPGFVNFVNSNTTLNSSGVREINHGSDLANFIIYNNERITPVGVTDGGILESLNGGGSSIPFISNILSIIKAWLGADENNKRIASGAMYLNSSSNSDWQNTYKYAQRYVSLARATAALKLYDGGETAYNNMEFFEGDENPVIAFLNNYYNIAKQ